MTTTTTPSRVAQAEAYVRSRFYPPLPIEYGALAVEAVDLVNAGEPEAPVDVSTLPIQPKGTDDEGRVTAARMVEALHLEHLIETDCGPCEGYGTLEQFDPTVGEVVREATCDYCGGSGRI